MTQGQPIDPHDADIPNPNPEGHELPPVQDVYVDPASVAARYELHDVRLRPVYWFTGTLLLGILVVMIILFWLVQTWTQRPLAPRVEMSPAAVAQPEAPGPGLEVVPESELDAYLRREQERLNGYGWVDRNADRVYIPIDQAIQMLVAQGVVAQQEITPTFRLAPAYQLDSSGGLLITQDETTAGESQGRSGAGPSNAATGGDAGDKGAPGAGAATGEGGEEVGSGETPAEENAGGADEGAGGDVTTPPAPGEVTDEENDANP